MRNMSNKSDRLLRWAEPRDVSPLGAGIGKPPKAGAYGNERGLPLC